MVRQAPFTKYEAVLLLDALLQTVSGAVSRKEAIKNCSAALRSMAKSNGNEIDDTYRNVNGITFQMASMESAYRGETIIKPATRLFKETVEMYKNDSKEYEKILKEAKTMAESNQNNEAKFMAWLSTKVSAAQLSELYMVFQEIEQQAKKVRLVNCSLYENIESTLFKKIKGNIEQNKVFKFTYKRQVGRINSALNYLIQYAQEQQNLPKKESVSETPVKMVETKISENDALEEKGNVNTVSFTTMPDMAFTKPVAFSYFGEYKQEESWRTLYVDLCYLLIQDYPEKFAHMMRESIDGQTKTWLADKQHINLLAAPRETRDGYYIETNRSVLDIIKSIRWILEQCNIDYDNVTIEYIKRGDGEPQCIQLASANKRKYSRDDKEDFYRWMLNDQHMTEASSRGYISAIREAEIYAEEHNYSQTKLLGVSPEGAKETVDLLFGDEEFIEKNTEQHNRFGTAITKLSAYYGVVWTVTGRAGTKASTIKVQSTIDIKPYSAVLESYFPRGYRVGSSIEMKRFRRYYEEVNGTELKIDSEKVEAAILQSGIEHGGRVYAPQTMIDEKLKEKIFAYIEECFAEGKTVLYFEAIFREFSEEFLDHNIYDAEMLKTYISHTADGKYFIGRGYLSSERRTAADPIDDVRMCLKECGLPMSVDDLCQTLSHIPEEKIKAILGTNLEFVRNSKGEYFHVDSFSLSEEELEGISAIISAEIETHEYISGNELYDAIKSKYPYAYERNTAFSMIGWRDTLKYKLGDQYSFAGNVISAKGKDLSMSDVFSNYAKEQGDFTLQELLAFSENIGTTVYFDALYTNAARISLEQFIDKNSVTFQVKATDKILDRFCVGTYLALPKITDFGIFPEASHPWTPFLLEHYLAYHSECYRLMHVGYNRNIVVGAMVKTTKQYANFDELVTDVLAESGVTLQKKSALDYLSDNGYIARRSYTNIEAILINARAKRNKKEK